MNLKQKVKRAVRPRSLLWFTRHLFFQIASDDIHPSVVETITLRTVKIGIHIYFKKFKSVFTKK